MTQRKRLQHSKKRFASFGIVGGITTLLYVSQLWAMHEFLSLPAWFSTILAIVLSKQFNFFANRALTFKETAHQKLRHQYFRFVASTSLGSGINYFTTLGLIEFVSFFSSRPHYAGAIGVVLSLLFNYIANFYFVFSSRDRDGRDKHKPDENIV